MTASLTRRWAFFLFGLFFSIAIFAKEGRPIGIVTVADLPRQARLTLARIKAGGPFPYAKDGVVFRNYEGVLPKRKRGYYHEFTVKVPGIRGRGARRIITGGNPASSGEYFYTDDHYATFKRIKE